MRKLGLLVLACAGCAASDPNATTITSQQLVGTWNGKASVGKSYRFLFGADGSFQFGLVKDGTMRPLSTGSFSIADRHQLTLTGTVPDESGTLHHIVATSDAYASGNQFCDSALYAAEAYDSFVGDWTTTTSTVEVDASGTPIGSATTSVTKLSFDGNGFVLQDIDGQQIGGTYSRTGDQITVAIPEGSGGVLAVRTFTLIDNSVLCDPAYSK